MKKVFTPAELTQIGEKVRAARAELLAKGFNPHPRYHLLFRGQIAKMAGVTYKEMAAYNFHLVRKMVQDDEKRRSWRNRLRNFFRSLGAMRLA